MTVKLAILKSGEDIIADVKEMLLKDEEGKGERVIGYFLHKPCGVSLSNEILKTDDADTDSFKIKLFPWCPLTKTKVIPITSDWVVTLVDPIDKLKLMYETQVLNYGTSKSADTDQPADSSKSD